MSKRVSFKLYDKDAVGNPLDELGLSLAFQRHCHKEFGITDDLNIMVKKVWLKFLRDAVDKSQTPPSELDKAGLTEVADVGGEVQSAGDIGSDAVEPPSVPVAALADTPAVSDPATPT